MDDRFRALGAWLAEVLVDAPMRIERASTDASFRRYFRVFLDDGRTLIAMDAPPERENSRAFVQVAGLLRGAGLNAPEILRHDFAQGFLLVADLGTTSYLSALNAGNAKDLFGDATTALVKWQATSRAGELPAYDEALLMREVDLFPDWYVERHLGAKFTPAAAPGLRWRRSQGHCKQPRRSAVFVHRDFMPRNLMVAAPNPGILDFQDAVYGPISYDIACLYRDAFMSLGRRRGAGRDDPLLGEGRGAPALPVPGDFATFWRDVEWMGLQRHLKVLGIFARLQHRDGKDGYIEDAPRFIGYVRHAVSRYDELSPAGAPARRDRRQARRSALHVLMAAAIILAAGRGERLRPAHRHGSQAAARRRGPPAHRVAGGAASCAPDSRDLVVNHAHLGSMIETAARATARASAPASATRPNRPALETAGGIAKALPLLGGRALRGRRGRHPHGLRLRAPACAARIDRMRSRHPLRALGFGGQSAVARAAATTWGSWTDASCAAVRASRTRASASTIRRSSAGSFRARWQKLFPWAYGFADEGRVTGEHYRGPWDNVGTAAQLEALDKRISR